MLKCVNFRQSDEITLAEQNDQLLGYLKTTKSDVITQMKENKLPCDD